MHKYTYEGMNKAGSREKGYIQADSVKEAMTELRRQQIVPIKVRRIWLPQQKNNLEKFRINFCKQMAVMLEAGIPTMQAVDISMGNREDVKGMLKDNLAKGYALSTAMQMSKGYFSDFMVSVVRAGELSGNLPQVLSKLHEILKKNHDSKEKLKGIMIYPMFLCSVSGFLMLLLLYQVLPVFATVFAGFDAQLPWITTMLLKLGDNLTLYLGQGMVVFLLVGGILYRIYHTHKGGIFLDRLRLGMPLLGRLCRQREQAVFFNTMAMLINSGISIRRSLELLENICQNMYLQFKYKSMNRQLAQGSSLSGAMSVAGVYSHMEMTVVGAGEKSGELAGMLAYMGEICQQEANGSMDRFSTMVEPVIILLLGLVVGGIVMSTILPILDMMTLF